MANAIEEFVGDSVGSKVDITVGKAVGLEVGACVLV